MNKNNSYSFEYSGSAIIVNIKKLSESNINLNPLEFEYLFCDYSTFSSLTLDPQAKSKTERIDEKVDLQLNKNHLQTINNRNAYEELYNYLFPDSSSQSQ